MAGNRSPRQVASVYQRLRFQDGREGAASASAPRTGPGRPSTARGRGSGRGRGRPRRDRPPPPALDQPEDPSATPQDHVAATGPTTDTPSGDEGATQTDEGTQQTEDGSTQSSPYLRGPTNLPPVPLPDLRPVVRPVGRRYVLINVITTTSYDMLQIKRETDNFY